jgi:H+/Cl- antiporter ClcA
MIAKVRAGLQEMLVWLPRLALLCAAVGSASALFLSALEYATRVRFAQPAWLFALPLVGFGVGWLYHRLGGRVGGGHDLILDEIHTPGAGVPRRMAPLIWLGTVATHLAGGAAGREGTAVQMGGSLASALARPLRLHGESLRRFLVAGVAAGFGAVFGTPWAGAVFAAEVLPRGRRPRGAFPLALVAALGADMVCHGWGARHAALRLTTPALTGWTMALGLFGAALAGGIFGVVARAFAASTHAIQRALGACIAYPPWRSALGGVLVIGLTCAAGTRAYLGLGVWPEFPGDPTVASCFGAGDVPPFAWAWKLLFTAVTLGAGFKGGEVTPLFFIGATLGHALGTGFGTPTDVTAALGLLAVFAAATHTPGASTLLGVELFGFTHAPLFAAGCLAGHLANRGSGIYAAQRRPD